MMIHVLVIYMWMYIHRPFEVWPTLAEWRIERLYIAIALICWLATPGKTFVVNRLNGAIAFFGTAITVSTLVNATGPFPNLTVETWYKSALLFFLLITTVRRFHEVKLVIAAFLAVIGLYMVHSLYEYMCGRGVSRMGIWRLVGVDKAYGDPNTFSATIVYALPLVYPMWCAATRKMHRWLLTAYVLLSILCVLLTGSRGSFVGLLGLAFLTILFSQKRMRVLLVLCILAPVFWMSMSSSLKNRFMTIVDESYGPQNAIESAEGRRLGWQNGVRLFKEHPLLGVGPGEFARASGLDLQPHHLYGQTLGELGVAGAIGLFMLVWSFARNIVECRSVGEGVAAQFGARVAVAVGFSVALLLIQGLVSHNLYRYTWLWLAAFQCLAVNLVRNSDVGQSDVID